MQMPVTMVVRPSSNDDTHAESATADADVSGVGGEDTGDDLDASHDDGVSEQTED